MKNDQQYNLYNKLSRICFVLLHKHYVDGDMDTLETSFINGLYNTLQVSFDITVTKELLESFVHDKNADDKHDIMAFLSQALEHKNTYILLNYYFLKFILSYTKVVKSEYKQEFQDLLNEHHISMRDFAVTDEEYSKIMTGSSINNA